jgi:hypothetical protein
VPDAAEQWKELNEALGHYVGRLAKITSVNVNARAFRQLTANVAQQYFRSVRPELLRSGLPEVASELDAPFQTLLQLSHGNNAASSYRKQTKRIRKIAPRVTAALAVNQAVPASNAANTEDMRVIETLSAMLPSAAASYKQALIDLGDPERLSFRGPALELREALREVLDHLAPDDAVMKSENFKLESGRTKPTMKQKVRFILKARGRSKSEIATPENTATTVDTMVGDLTRSVYDKSSVATHIVTSRRNVGQIKMYVRAVLHDILEL